MRAILCIIFRTQDADIIAYIYGWMDFILNLFCLLNLQQKKGHVGAFDKICSKEVTSHTLVKRADTELTGTKETEIWSR